MNDLMKQENKELKEIVTREKVIEYVQTFLTGQSLTNNEVDQFVQIATVCNLNPFKKEIHCIAYGNGNYRKLSIVTGYEVYLKRAEGVGILNGWNVTTVGGLRKVEKVVTRNDKTGKSYDKKVTVNDGDLRAIITIHRKDWKEPFTHEVFFNEYNQENEIWNSKPITMIKKVVTAQGFRLCFPKDFDGMPYIQEEMTTEIKDITPESNPLSEKEIEFSNKWSRFENICVKIKDKLNPAENESIVKIGMAKDVNKVTLKQIDDMITYFEKKYEKDLTEKKNGLFDDNGQYEPTDMTLDLGEKEAV
jgi:phage recombination protein Bet